MRKLRVVRADDWVPPASNLESRFDQIMNRAGVVSLRRQVDLGGEEWTGRVDFLDCDCPLVIEILSERYHTALSDRQADEDRRNRLQALGLTVVEVWDHEIFYTPWLVVQRVLKTRQALMAAA
jgi:very-short-patch-repair endonuclease